MNFWIRNIIFGGILVVLAMFLLDNQDALLSLAEALDSENTEQQAPKEEPAITPTDIDKPVIKPPQKTLKKVDKKSSNAAAEGLSNFYASIYGGSEDVKMRENVVYLSIPDQDLSKILDTKAKTTRAFKDTWRGSKESRPFRVGQTMFQKISEYAKEDGLEVFWWLDKDFLVKDPFRIDHEILKTAYQIGKAIEGHFPNGLKVYFCHKQRAIVYIENDIEYLHKQCQLLTNQMLKTRTSRY